MPHPTLKEQRRLKRTCNRPKTLADMTHEKYEKSKTWTGVPRQYAGIAQPSIFPRNPCPQTRRMNSTGLCSKYQIFM